MINVSGKKFDKIDEVALGKALDGVEMSVNEKSYVDLVTNTINSGEQHVVEYLDMSGAASSGGVTAVKNHLNGVQAGIGDAMMTPEGELKAATITVLGGEGFNVPTKGGSHSFIISGTSNQDNRAVTSAHEVLGHGLPSARGESATQNNNAIRADNLVRRILGLPQRDGSNHAGAEGIMNPSAIPYLK